MSYPLHKIKGTAGSGTVRTEKGLWGLDLSGGADSLSRAADTKNLIWEGEAVKKRPGYTVFRRMDGAINGLFPYRDRLLIHAGGMLYEGYLIDGEPIGVNELEDQPSFGFSRRQRLSVRILRSPSAGLWRHQDSERELLFIRDGKTLRFYDGDFLRPAADSYWGEDLYQYGTASFFPDFAATVPFTAVGKHPTKGGGETDPRGENRLSQFCCESFYLPHGETAEYFRLNCLTKRFNQGIPPEIRLRDASGVWRTLSSGNTRMVTGEAEELVQIKTSKLTAGMAMGYNADGDVIDLQEGKTTLADDGMDNVRIVYGVLKAKPDALTGAAAFGFYGAGGADNVLFLGGSPARPGEDAFSAPDDFLCFYDTSVEQLGRNTTPVTGYCHLSDGRLAVLKDDPVGPTVFFRSHTVAEVGKTLAGVPFQVEAFPSEAGASVEGCIAPQSVGMAGNEPCFLSRSGLYAVRSVTNERYNRGETVRRSLPVDPLLTQMDPQKIRAVAWKDYFILACDKTMLVTDGRRDSAGQLRFMRWELAHGVTALAVLGDELYFGDAEGTVYRFGDFEDDAGVPIEAFWRTAPVECGDGHRLLLRSLWASLCPAYGARLSARVVRDRTPCLAQEFPLGRCDFGDWDFAHLSFDGTGEPRWLSLCHRTVRGASVAVETDLTNAADAKLCGFRMQYEKGGKNV